MPRHNTINPRSRCGACVVLNRGCHPQCIFAPYFRCERGTAHFATVREVFTIRNVVNLLTPFSINDRFWASDTLLFEAQARLQDPVYGCVSHILALQQQVSELQAYCALLQNSLLAYYSTHPYSAPQPDPNPNWSSSPPTIPEATLSHNGETSSSQMPLLDDLDELGLVIFGHRRRP
ncbi:LOB domain-containing protein 18-like [Diospyros lotus]|uniref:LOB domain-containing protein 18-like n=1 Tax=Diospyros lotus TaxID=55363 RepID=UPI002253633B|nr:LOB domain-containing protein 18-like [Diospyros lotus]